MDDYYSPHPTMVLKRPLAICGFWGARVPETAIRISCVTGIPVVDIERGLEHHLGMSLGEFVDINGPHRLLAEEEKYLPRMLPTGVLPPIVILRPQTMLSSRNRRLLLSRTETVYLNRSVDQLFSRIIDLYDRGDRSRFQGIPVENPRDLSQISDLLDTYRRYYHKADHIIDVEEHPMRVAEKIQDRIQVSG